MHTSLTQDSRKSLSRDWRGIRFPSCYTRAARSGSPLAGPGRGQDTVKGRDAVRTLQEADIAGIRALVVHAKDEVLLPEIRFRPLPFGPDASLRATNKDVRRIVSGQ